MQIFTISFHLESHISEVSISTIHLMMLEML